MAKEEKGKIKIRYLEVDLEGTNDTLQEVIRSVTAVAGRAPTIIRTKALPSGQDQQDGREALLEGEKAEIIDTVEEIVTPPPQTTKSKSKKRSYVTPQILSIDLKKGPTPFSEFCKTKNPDSTIMKYLVCAAWLKENLQEDEISIDHIYTCFRAMGWGVQRDLGQTFRSGKQQGYFDSGSKNGTWKINHIGLDKVIKLGSGS